MTIVVAEFQTSPTGVPFLLMTATCPPPLRTELFSSIGIDDCHVIHAPTDRPEISYNVILSPELKQSKELLVKAVGQYLSKNKSADTRGLIYCRRKEDVEELANQLGCMPFHADRPIAEREDSFNAWVAGKVRFMVCSSLLGCGIDVDSVRIVMHYGTPWSILDFVQESGRAGRGGQKSWSFVFASHDEIEPDDEDLYGKQLAREWVLHNENCRRTTLSSFLDGGRTSCMLLKDAQFCDVCKKASKQEHPGRLSGFSLPKIPNGNVPKISKPHIPPSSIQYTMDRTVALESEM